MPKRGELATECKYGHDLTLPDARLKPQPSRRGAGECRLCVVERMRSKRGSTKTGPPSRYKGDETARLAAIAAGLKRCPECEESKELTEFWTDKHTADGKGVYCKSCATKAKTPARLARRDEIIERAQAKRFGISVDALRDMKARQNHVCAICFRACPTGRSLAVDHDHTTGQVRELLCANCNRAIGLLQDSATLATRVADYLTRWQSDGQAGVSRTELPSTD